jgi:hypothetical protein
LADLGDDMAAIPGTKRDARGGEHRADEREPCAEKVNNLIVNAADHHCEA